MRGLDIGRSDVAYSREQLIERQKRLGSSDMVAILGLSKYKTPYDVYLEKTNQVELETTTSTVAELGLYLEPALLKYGADKLGLGAYEHDKLFIHKNGVHGCQCDGWLVDGTASIEVKTSGLMNPRADLSDWGTGETDVPFSVLAQVNHAMFAAGLERVYIVALLGQGIGVRMYTIERDEALCQKIKTIGENFWNTYVIPQVPPEGLPTLEVAARVKREAGMITPIAEEYALRYDAICEQEKLIKDAKENLKLEILKIMGEAKAEIAASPAGSFEYLENARGVRAFRLTGVAK